MKIHLIAIGQKPPGWVVQGLEQYTKRMPDSCRVELIEVAAPKRTKSQSIEKLKAVEGERLLNAVPASSMVIALDEHGKMWRTMELANKLDGWQQDGRDVSLLVGGADGLSAPCLERAELRWSLSAMTLPHALVRIVVAEQLYRAWSVLQGHPYHRE
ncbi:MAG: 23S rRNA (pseudouridine(1915)-N(3))-methyltransferase RlmH [Gammaproteobacteria bacterium]|nr:23S rRNA (pseudouridine(1915)-N(3))-methyltransferase RlmH [Gammaproteobacteria bacterium]